MNKKGILLLLSSLCLVGCTKPAESPVIEQTTSYWYTELGTDMKLEASDFFFCQDSDVLEDITFQISDVNLFVPGEYGVVATYDEQSFGITVCVTDTTAPVFELNDLTVSVGDEISALDYVASAFDLSEDIQLGVSYVAENMDAASPVITSKADTVSFSNTSVTDTTITFPATGDYWFDIAMQDVHGNVAIDSLLVTVK